MAFVGNAALVHAAGRREQRTATYFRALAVQGAEDLSAGDAVGVAQPAGAAHRAQQHVHRAVGRRIWRAMLVMMAIGALVVLLRSRRALVTLIAAFGPYLVFDVLFQEAVTSRYALPMVVPFTYLVIRGLLAMPRPVATGGAAIAIAACLWPGLNDVRAYASAPAPGFVMLDDMAAAKSSSGFVLAMHRREDIDFRRSLQWSANAPLPSSASRRRRSGSGWKS